MKVTIQHWPVLERKTTKEGKVGRTKKSYVRSKAPTQEREVDVDAFTSTSRVRVYFGSGHWLVFSVHTGRRIGHADWILREDSHKMIREHMKELGDTFAAFQKEIWWVVFGGTVPELREAEEPEDDLPDALASPPANDVAS